MKGCRSLSEEELDRIKTHFNQKIGNEIDDKYNLETRNKTLFFFGLYSGWRISEILSLKISDVCKVPGVVNDYINLKKENSKGKFSGRVAPINGRCKDLLKNYVEHYRLADRDQGQAFWISMKRGGLGSRQALNLYKRIFQECQMSGNLATHTTRKTFSGHVFKDAGENIFKLQQAMGHKLISSTQAYIQHDSEEIKSLVTNLNF